MSTDLDQSDPAYEASLELYFGKEFVTHGYRRRPDPLSGRRTAIGRQHAGFTARSRAQGAPVNGADFPRPVRDAVRASLRDLGQLQFHAFWYTPEGFRNLLIGSGTPPPEIESVVHQARQVLPLLEWSAIDRLRRLPHVDMPGAEAHVYFDPEIDAVYKVIQVFEDGNVDAVSPGRITDLNDAGRSPTFHPYYPVNTFGGNILEYAIQQLTASLYDHIVLTELVGLTQDGRFLILKQPYLRGLTFGWSVRRKSMGEQLGLRLIGANGSPTFIGTLPDRIFLLVVDAHERNLVYSAPDLGENEELDENTPAFLVDPTAKVLDMWESEILAPLIRESGWRKVLDGLVWDDPS